MGLGGATNSMFVTSGGNVGVGINNPSAKLDVAGTVKLGSLGTAFNNIIRSSNLTTSMSIGANNTSVQTYTVSGASTGASVMVSPNSPINAGLVIAYARVSAANTVEVAYRNTTGTAIGLTANIPLFITVIQ
jgi:trimeric autotransporter adhesin